MYLLPAFIVVRFLLPATAMRGRGNTCWGIFVRSGGTSERDVKQRRRSGRAAMGDGNNGLVATVIGKLRLK